MLLHRIVKINETGIVLVCDGKCMMRRSDESICYSHGRLPVSRGGENQFKQPVEIQCGIVLKLARDQYVGSDLMRILKMLGYKNITNGITK